MKSTKKVNTHHTQHLLLITSDFLTDPIVQRSPLKIFGRISVHDEDSVIKIRKQSSKNKSCRLPLLLAIEEHIALKYTQTHILNSFGGGTVAPNNAFSLTA